MIEASVMIREVIEFLREVKFDAAEDRMVKRAIVHLEEAEDILAAVARRNLKTNEVCCDTGTTARGTASEAERVAQRTTGHSEQSRGCSPAVA